MLTTLECVIRVRLRKATFYMNILIVYDTVRDINKAVGRSHSEYLDSGIDQYKQYVNLENVRPIKTFDFISNIAMSDVHKKLVGSFLDCTPWEYNEMHDHIFNLEHLVQEMLVDVDFFEYSFEFVGSSSEQLYVPEQQHSVFDTSFIPECDVVLSVDFSQLGEIKIMNTKNNGFVWLNLVRQTNEKPAVHDVSLTFHCKEYISSSLMKSSLLSYLSKLLDYHKYSKSEVSIEVHGPAVNLTVFTVEDDDGLIYYEEQFDIVLGIKMPGWPKCAWHWPHRKRKWPSPQQINVVTQKGYHFVPKAAVHGHSDLDWRVSFSLAVLNISATIWSRSIL